MSSGSTGRRGGGDAKTIISPNTSFGDIITPHGSFILPHRVDIHIKLMSVKNIVILIHLV